MKDNNVQYGFGLSIIESVCVETGVTYAINFYSAVNPEMVGIHQSHGLTYAEARKAYKKGHIEPFGLEKKILEVEKSVKR